MKAASRRTLFRIHSWIGLNLGLLLFAVCFSGTIAIFSPELHWLADRDMRAGPAAGEGDNAASWQALHDSVAEAYPNAKILYLLAPRGDGFAARAVIGHASGGFQYVLLDPHTAEVQGLRSGFNITSFLRIYHKQLYIVPTIFFVHGTWITGILAILLLVSAIAGLLFMTRRRRAFVTLRRGRSRRLFWSDMHRLTGIWALAITVVFALTGIWYLVERGLTDAEIIDEDIPPPTVSADTLKERQAVLEPLPLDRAVALTEAAFPALTVTRIAFPARPAAPLVFVGQAEAWLVRDRANAVALDPYSGDVLGIRHGTELGAFDRWIETADPLHFGTFAGLTSRIVWFVAGLLLCAGILTGLYTAWMRSRQLEEGAPKRRLAATAAVVPAVLIILGSIIGAWLYSAHALMLAQRPDIATTVFRGPLGPWTVVVDRHDDPAAPEDRARIGVRFDGGHANFRKAALGTGSDDPAAKPLRVRRFNDRLLLRAPCPADAAACPLTLEIDEWNGTRHTVTFDLKEAGNSAATPLPVAAGISVGEGVMIAAFGLCLLLPMAGWIRLQFR